MPGWLELTELMGISITYAVSRRVERRADRVNNEREVEAPSELGRPMMLLGKLLSLITPRTP